MSLINWEEAKAADLSGFATDLLREELCRRQLGVTGSKEDIINRLLAHIMECRLTPTPQSSDATDFAAVTPLGASPAMSAFTTDPVESMQLLVTFLKQNPSFVTLQP